MTTLYIQQLKQKISASKELSPKEINDIIALIDLGVSNPLSRSMITDETIKCNHQFKPMIDSQAKTTYVNWYLCSKCGFVDDRNYSNMPFVEAPKEKQPPYPEHSDDCVY